jgi:hypothetical protein
MEPGHRLTTVVLLLLAGVALPACGGANGDQRPYDYDTPLARNIEAFRQAGPHGATRRLDAMTSFDWDTVHIFAEGASYADIDRTVGFDLFGRDGRYGDNDGTLLIFTKDRRLASAQALIPPVRVGARASTFARQGAALRALTPDPGPYAFELLESAPSP